MEEEELAKVLERKNNILDYGSLIYLNFIDRNGNIYFAFSEDIKTPYLSLQARNRFFQSSKIERGLFKILPKFLNSSYEESNTKYGEILEAKKLNGYLKLKSQRDSDLVVGSLLKEMYNELDDNLEILRRNNAQPIKFGNMVQFLHVETQKFLGFVPSKNSAIEPDNLAIELMDEFSDLTTFKLLPVFNYQANNKGIIMNNDEVYIMSCAEQTKNNFDPYLNASKSFSLVPGGPKKKELNVTIEKLSSFRINIVNSYIDDFDKILKVHDVVGISYSELGLNLCSIGYSEQETQYGLLTMKETVSAAAGLQGNSNGMFRIENYDDSTTGGFVEWGKPYSLKHLASNKYICAKDLEELLAFASDDGTNTLLVSSRTRSSKHTLGSARKQDKSKKVVFNTKPNSLKIVFEIIPSTLGSKSRGATMKFVMRDSYIKLRLLVGETPLWLQVKEERRESASGIASLEPVFSAFDKDNIFKLNKFSLQTVGATNYILSTKQTIITYLMDHLVETQEQKQTRQTGFSKYNENLGVLINLLSETEFTLECFFKLQELCYNRLLEYPSPHVPYNSLDEAVLQTLKQQDFIQIMLRYMICLFGSVDNLYEFRNMNKLSKELAQELGSRPAGGFPGIPELVLPANHEMDSGLPIGSPKFALPDLASPAPEANQSNEEGMHAPPAAVSSPNKATILTHQDVIKLEIQMKKRDILLMCYKIINAMTKENENIKQFMSQYIHLMQMQSYFFPEIIDEITQLFSTNQEILLKLKKKTFNKNLIFVGGSGLNKHTGFKWIELPQLNEEIHHLLLEFYEAEGIKTSGRNFFFFYCYYLLHTDSLEVRQKILRLFTAVSVFEDQGINSNQEEIYSQIKSNFKEMFRTQFYALSSRGQDLMIINPQSLRAEKLPDVFAVLRHKKEIKESARLHSSEKAKEGDKTDRKGFFKGLEDFGKRLPNLKIGELFGGASKPADKEVPLPLKSPLPSQPHLESQPNLDPRQVESNKVSLPSQRDTPLATKQNRGFSAAKLSSAALLSRHDSSDQEDLETMKQDQESKEKAIARMPFEDLPALTDEERHQFTEQVQDDGQESRMSDLSYEDALNAGPQGGAADMFMSEAAKRARIKSMRFTDDQKFFILIQLQFYAGMCLDRNYIWKGYLEQKGYFNFDAILHNLKYKFEEWMVGSALAKLLHHMYIDQKPMYKVIVPQYSKIIASLNQAYSPGNSVPPSGDMSPIDLHRSTKDQLVGVQGSKRPTGFNLEYVAPHPKTKQVQEMVLSFMADLKATLKSLPRKLSELQSDEAFDKFEEAQQKLSNDLVLEMLKLVQTVFEFGYYTIEVLPSQKHYLPVQLGEAGPESDLTPVLRVLVKLMEFEPEIPEIRLLLKSLRSSIKHFRTLNDIDSRTKFQQKLQRFKFAEQYDKMAIVEDVERKEDESFAIYEAYFRQYLSKDITFKEHFNYRNKTLEQIKLKVMKVVHSSIDLLTEGYANRVIEVFKNCVQQLGLDRQLLTSAKSSKSDSNKQQYEQVFADALTKAIDEVTPAVSLTGVSLDVLLDVLSLKKTVPKNLDINSLLGPSLFPSLILLFTFNQESDTISSSCIELLIKIFSLRVQVLRIVKEVMIVQGDDGFKTHYKMRKYQRELKDLCDESENWIKSPLEGLRKKKLDRVLKCLDWMCQQLSDDPEENLGNPSVLERKEFQINGRVQDALRNLKVHEIAVDFIRDTFYIVNESYEDATDPLVIRYFTAIFLFLIKFVYKNPRNQLLLSKEISVFLQESKIDVGQVSLIIEIYRDNLLLCKQNHEIVTDDFIRWILNYGRRERFLDFFLGLMKCDGVFITENQRKILSLFLDHPRKLDLLFITPPSSATERSHSLCFDPKTDTQNRFYYDEPYKYHSKMLQLLCYACVGKSGVFVNEIKVRDLFEFSYLLEILEGDDSFTSPVTSPKAGHEKPEADRENPGINLKIVPEIVESSWALPPLNLGGNPEKRNIHLKRVVNQPTDSHSADRPFLVLPSVEHSPQAATNSKVVKLAKPGIGSHLYPVSQSNGKSNLGWLTQHLKRVDSQEALEQQRCVSLNTKEARNQLKCSVAELVYYVYFESNSVSRELLSLKPRILKFFQEETERIQTILPAQITSIYTQYVFRHLLRLAAGAAALLSEDEEAEVRETISSPVNNGNRLNTQETAKANTFQDLEQEPSPEFNIKEGFINTFANKLTSFGVEATQNYRKELQAASTYFQFDFGPINSNLVEVIGLETKLQAEPVQNLSDAWVRLWSSFQTAYMNHHLIKDKILEEKKVLSQSLNQIEDILKIPLIMNPDLEQELRPILIHVNKKKVIKSIIDFLQENTKQSDRKNVLVEVLFCLAGMIPLDDEGGTNSQNIDAVKKEQEFLADCGAIKMIMKQLTDPLLPLQSDDFTANLLLFAIRMLEGGNTSIQQEFYTIMVNDETSEQLFSKIYEIFTKEQEHLSNGTQSPNTALVGQILRFFQHLAEGHFQDLQLYLRRQTNSLRSFNFLEETVSLLSGYVSADKTDYFENILTACETITELIQGPCFENQKVLMQGRMMETVAKILSMDEFYHIEARKRKITLENSRYCLKPWMIARIKYKVSVALVSLVECRKDDVILNKMYTGLKKYLVDNITSFFLGFSDLYGSLYTERVFEHLNFEPDQSETLKEEEQKPSFHRDDKEPHRPAGSVDQPGTLAVKASTSELSSEIDRKQQEVIVIIQTAFNFYVILRKRQESDEKDDDDPETDPNDFVSQVDAFTKKLLQTQELQEIEQEINPQTPEELKRYMERIRSKNSKEALEFMKQKVRTIEVVRQDEALERVYFLTEPYFEAINNEIKDEFNQEVTRVSCKTKCNDLLEQSAALIEKLKRERVIMRHRVLKYVHSAHYTLKVTSYLLVLAVNILTLVFYTQTKDEAASLENAPVSTDTTEQWVYQAQLILGILIAAHGVVIFIFDTYRELPVLQKIAQNSGVMKSVDYFFTERTNIVYYALYTAVAIIGWFMPAWYTFLLNDIMNINSILRNIVRSVWRPRTSLLLTLILFVIVLYAFSSIAFVYFSQAYANSMPNQRACRTVFECFLLTFDKGMKFDGAIGNYLKMNNEDTLTTEERVPVDIGRFVYENLLLIFAFIIILNIVTGIIIDTFGSLREEYNGYIEDSETYCFICGYSVEEIEKEAGEGENFEYHVKQEHYQWNYLFYIGYILDKKSTERTGLESYIADLISQEEISWFPNHRAMMVQENAGLNPSDAVDETIKLIQTDEKELQQLATASKRALVKYQNIKETKNYSK